MVDHRRVRRCVPHRRRAPLPGLFAWSGGGDRAGSAGVPSGRPNFAARLVGVSAGSAGVCPSGLPSFSASRSGDGDGFGVLLMTISHVLSTVPRGRASPRNYKRSPTPPAAAPPWRRRNTAAGLLTPSWHQPRREHGPAMKLVLPCEVAAKIAP
jgi:hypothetical protein